MNGVKEVDSKICQVYIYMTDEKSIGKKYDCMISTTYIIMSDGMIV